MIYSSVVERMEMDSGAKVIVRDPEILGGIPVFLGTRVPFKNLLDYLEGGHTLDEFLQEFPFVTRSEEHTSELQSRGHLVCRLLLEKKKTQQTINPSQLNRER